MPAVYRNMQLHLREFEKYRKQVIAFDTLDYDFYENLVEFLSYAYVHKRRRKKIVGLKRNTVGKTIKQLRIFLLNRMRKKITPIIDLSGWTILSEDVDTVYLGWEEINRIHHVDLSAFPYLIPYRNDFVLGCLTGLRFSDFSDIDISDVRNGMLHIKQQKSDT